MKYIRWTLFALVALVVGAFLHYSLVRQDVVRIVGSEVRRIEIVGVTGLFYSSSEPTDASGTNRDVKFISAVFESGRTRVYRNEDTGFGWPPYLKFDSADLQARASDLESGASDPRWVRVSYYGWRSNLLSIYPNALRAEEVSGPDDRAFPWTNVLTIGSLVIAVLLIRALILRIWRRNIAPVFDEVEDAFDTAGQSAESAEARLRRKRNRLQEWWAETFR